MLLLFLISLALPLQQQPAAQGAAPHAETLWAAVAAVETRN